MNVDIGCVPRWLPAGFAGLRARYGYGRLPPSPESCTGSGVSLGVLPALPRDPGGDLAASIETQLVEDVPDVGLGGRLGDSQFLGDLAVPEAVGYQSRHLPLTLRDRAGRRHARLAGHRRRPGLGVGKGFGDEFSVRQGGARRLERVESIRAQPPTGMRDVALAALGHAGGNRLANLTAEPVGATEQARRARMPALVDRDTGQDLHAPDGVPATAPLVQHREGPAQKPAAFGWVALLPTHLTQRLEGELLRPVVVDPLGDLERFCRSSARSIQVAIGQADQRLDP